MISIRVKENDTVHTRRLTQDELIIGRSSKAHLKISDASCSALHCAIYLDDKNRTVIRDLDSTNGTFINGQKIQGTYLYLNDIATLGPITIELLDEKMSIDEINLHQRPHSQERGKVLDFEIAQKRRVDPELDIQQKKIPHSSKNKSSSDLPPPSKIPQKLLDPYQQMPNRKYPVHDLDLRTTILKNISLKYDKKNKKKNKNITSSDISIKNNKNIFDHVFGLIDDIINKIFFKKKKQDKNQHNKKN